MPYLSQLKLLAWCGRCYSPHCVRHFSPYLVIKLMKSLRGLSYIFVAIIVLGVISPWSFFLFLSCFAFRLYTLSVLIRMLSRMVTVIRNTYFPRGCGILLLSASHTLPSLSRHCCLDSYTPSVECCFFDYPHGYLHGYPHVYPHGYLHGCPHILRMVTSHLCTPRLFQMYLSASNRLASQSRRCYLSSYVPTAERCLVHPRSPWLPRAP